MMKGKKQMNDKIKIFEDKQIRMEWNEEEQDWYLSIVDVISILTDQPTQRSASNYWRKMKQHLKEEGNELVTICHQLKLEAADGKRYLTDVANSKGILRIIQSIPSPKSGASTIRKTIRQKYCITT